MKLDEISSKNDEWYTPEYAIRPLLKYIPKDSIIWCPFDTPESNFVKILSDHGCCVFPTHIALGEDFFETEIHCDFIISNPPYSIKYEVFKRLFALDIPFAMLVGVVGLFESQKRFGLFKDNLFEIMYFNKRISFMSSYSDSKCSLNPPFSSVYITHKILPNTIVFEYVEK